MMSLIFLDNIITRFVSVEIAQFFISSILPELMRIIKIIQIQTMTLKENGEAAMLEALTIDKHYVAYLKDASKVIKITVKG